MAAIRRMDDGAPGQASAAREPKAEVLRPPLEVGDLDLLTPTALDLLQQGQRVVGCEEVDADPRTQRLEDAEHGSMADGEYMQDFLGLPTFGVVICLLRCLEQCCVQDNLMWRKIFCCHLRNIKI